MAAETSDVMKSTSRSIGGAVYAAILSLVPAFFCWGAPAAVPLFQNGDRVCFIGDSITGGSGKYHELIHLYYLTRFPDRKIDVVERGFPGDTAGRALARFPADIAPAKPTVATIMLGINDVGVGLYGETPDATPEIQARRDANITRYRDALTKLCAALAEAGSRIILLTPPPYDQTTLAGPSSRRRPERPRVNDGVARCVEVCMALSEQIHAPVVDVYGGMQDVLDRQHKTDPEWTMFADDRTHPHVGGQLVMAYLFLKAQNAPAVVSAVKIDAAGKAVLERQNCDVTGLAAVADSVKFILAAKALPLPLDTMRPEHLAAVPFMNDLNQETLRVTGLAPGAYALKIDGTAVGDYDASQLATGINLAENRRTPQYRQATEVAALVKKRGELSDRLRSLFKVECGPLSKFKGNPANMAEIKAHLDNELAGVTNKAIAYLTQKTFDSYMANKPNADKLQAEVVAILENLYQLNQPKPHQYELERTGGTRL